MKQTELVAHLKACLDTNLLPARLKPRPFKPESRGRSHCRASPDWTAEGGCPYLILGVVMAPSAAELTSAAYFANTPVL